MVWFGNRQTSSVTVIDDFESGSLSADYTSNTGEFSVTNAITPENGVYCLENPDTSFSRIEAVDGVDGVAFTKGETAKLYVRSSDGEDGVGRFLFGVQDSNSYYYAGVQFANERLFLARVDNGAVTQLDAPYSSSIFIDGGEWYEIEVVWDDGTLGGSDNDITFTLYDGAGGAVIAQATANDSTYSAENGVGFVGTNQASATVYFDYLHKP